MEELNRKLIRFDKIIISILLVISIIGGLIFGYVISEVKNFSGIENLKRFQPSIPTKIYDVNGELVAELFHEKRELISFEMLPRNLINAFLSAEDRDFYKHFGIDFTAIIRALIKNVAAGKIVQGGSTITQQLAKRLFTTGERTFARKALEAILALQIEKKYSKEEILEMYFNQIYLGHGCYGVASAAKLFFDKEVKYLNVAESAILSALPSAPGKYSPLLNAHTAYEKNWELLNRMVDSGFLTSELAKKIYREFWPDFIDSLRLEYPSKTVYSRSVDRAPYFTDYVRQILISRFGENVVYNKGLSVYTTLNLKRQRIGRKVLIKGIREQNKIARGANEYYDENIDKSFTGGVWGTLGIVFNLPPVRMSYNLEANFRKVMVDHLVDSADIMSLLLDARESNRSIESFRGTVSNISSLLNVEGAIVAIEPSSGYISTLIGGSGFSVDNQFNRAIQARRQPGSAFKPFLYGAGIESRILNAGTLLPDAPIVDIDDDGCTWSPANYEGKYYGMVNVRKALAASINIIAIRAYDLIGPDRVIEFASKMVKVPHTRFSANPTLALGTTELTPFEMAQGFAIFANRGRDVFPYAIRYVIDRDGNELVNIEEEVGKIIALREMEGSMQIISEDLAYIMTGLMKAVIDSGTATEAIRQKSEFRKKAVGKTGTTSNWTDAWFCGYTPDVVTIVWVGFDRLFMTLGKHQSGSAVAAPIWGQFMKEIYRDMKDPVFPPPPKGVYRSGEFILLKGTVPDPPFEEEEHKMKTVLERYMEKEGLNIEE